MSAAADIRNAVARASAGQTVTSDNISETPSSESTGAVVDGGDTAYANESVVDDGFSGESSETSGDAPTDSLATSGEEDRSSSETTPQERQKTSDREVITVTDESGRRRRVEIDYTDRKAIRKAHEMMYGARKWQADRDRAVSSVKETSEKLQKLQSDWDVLNQAFSKSGVEGLVDLLEGRPGAYKDHIRKQIDRAKFLERASPEELEQFNLREENERIRREAQRDREENEKFRREMDERREAAEEAAMRARITPVFEKYRFDGKLGDEEAELDLDEMLWESATKALKPYEEQGLELTPELIEQEFSRRANLLRKRINVQAEKKASAVIEQKKKEATENVQGKIRSGYREGGSQKEAQDLLEKNDLKGLFRNWGKYGGAFRR